MVQNISLVSEGRLVRLRLECGAKEPRSLVEIEMPPGDAMGLLIGLQNFQAKHRIPIPPSLRPEGKPRLTVVSDDD